MKSSTVSKKIEIGSTIMEVPYFVDVERIILILRFLVFERRFGHLGTQISPNFRFHALVLFNDVKKEFDILLLSILTLPF